MTDLGSLGTLPDGASYSMAFGINNDGQAVGWAESPGLGGQHAVMWDNGHIVDIGALPLPSNISPYALAVAINDRGQVVGTSNTGPLNANGQEVSHAFLWQNGIL